MGKKPIIGILSNLLITEQGMFPGMKRSYVNHDYVEAILLAGAIPVMLPVISDEDGIRQQLERVDGVLLSGGYDINPLYYGEEPCKELGFILPEVDEHQLAAVRIAVELGKPMLGICKGMQIINVAFGGSLHQDLLQIPTSTKHSQKAQRHVASHTVQVVQDTMLSDIFGKETVLTNSFHHQAIKAVAPGFIVSGMTADGVVEAIETAAAPFTLGVQWHPEMMAEKCTDMLKLFTRFVAASAATS